MRARSHIKTIGLAGLLTGLPLASAAGGAGAAAPAYDAAAWNSDYAELKTILERDYANLAWFGSPEGGVDLPRLDHQTQAALAVARSDEDARRAITQFVAAFHGGHFSILPTLAPAATVAPSAVDRPAFDAGNAAGTCASLGFNPSSAIAFSAPFESLPGFTLRGDGMSSVYRSGLATTAGGVKIGIIRIQNFRMRAFPAACTMAWAKLAADHTLIDSGSLRDAAYIMWYTAFGDEIAALRAAGAQALLIDVGNNSGGDDSGDLFPRLLTDKRVESARLLVVASATGAGFADEQIEDIDGVLAAKPAPDGETALRTARDYFLKAKAAATAPCDLSWVWREQRPWADGGCKRLVAVGYAGGYAASLPRGAYDDQNVSSQLSFASGADDIWGLWTGPLYVLTDANTFSSAEMFTAVVQDNHIGKIVGVKTGGDGCGFMGGGDPPVLYHSLIRLRIPNCIRLRRDGSNEVAGITPDLPVLPTTGEDDRQRAVRLLDTLAGDMKP